MALPQLDLSHLSAAYNPRKQAAGHHKLTPSELIRALYPKLAATHNVFIHLVPQSDLLERCKELEEQPHGQRGALWGVPFAVKDNVDVQGLPTTAGCPAFQYVAERSAPAIEALLRSGAVRPTRSCGA